MPEAAEWSEDRCTCGHPQSLHEEGTGPCKTCRNDASYKTDREGATARACRRFQWDGKERTRVW